MRARARLRHLVTCPVCHQVKSAGWVGSLAEPLLKLYTHRAPDAVLHAVPDDGRPVRCKGSGRLVDPARALPTERIRPISYEETRRVLLALEAV